jgi:hypothetical protein
MEKIMLIAGCSHAAGSEINGLEDSVYNRQHSFGNLVAFNYGYRPINIAQNGMTNSGITRSILKWIEKHYDPSKMELFVLVSWTESTRIEVPSNRNFLYNISCKAADWFDETSNTYFRINFGWEGGDAEEKALFPYYQEFMANNSNLLELQCINNVLLIQYRLQALNVKYVMCNAMHMFTTSNKHNKDLLSMVDSNRYYNMHNNDAAFFWKFRNLGYTNSKAKYWHHGEEPHQLYAKELCEFIGENKCL